MKPYDIVEALEKRVAEYAGAPYAVAVDSCTNALLLCLRFHLYEKNNKKTIVLPCRTYVGVAYAVINAGLKCSFENISWKGAYKLQGSRIVDSARRFRKNMYMPMTLWCLSAHWSKHLKIGRGGFILTDDKYICEVLKKMRFDGRTAGVKPSEDIFSYPGYHCYMLPEEAARGLMLMESMPDFNEDLPNDDYPDLSKFPIFRGK